MTPDCTAQQHWLPQRISRRSRRRRILLVVLSVSHQLRSYNAGSAGSVHDQDSIGLIESDYVHGLCRQQAPNRRRGESSLDRDHRAPVPEASVSNRNPLFLDQRSRNRGLEKTSLTSPSIRPCEHRRCDAQTAASVGSVQLRGSLWWYTNWLDAELDGRDASDIAQVVPGLEDADLFAEHRGDGAFGSTCTRRGRTSHHSAVRSGQTASAQLSARTLRQAVDGAGVHEGRRSGMHERGASARLRLRND